MPSSELEITSLQSHSDETPGEVSLMDLVIAIARRKSLILKVCGAALVLSAIVSLLIPDSYTARAVIMPPQQTQSTASMLMSQLAGSGLGSLAALAGRDLGLKNPNDLYIGILKSRTIEDALVQKFQLQRLYHHKKVSDARKELEQRTKITSGKEGLIFIAVEDEDPTRAANLANEYLAELRELLQNLAVSEAGQRRLFFEQQLQKSKDDLANAEVALKDTQQRTGMIQLDSQSKAIIEAVGRIRAQIASKEVELHAMSSFATEQNPDYVLLRQQIDGLHAQLAKVEQPPSQNDSDPLLATGKIPAVGLEYVRRLREVKYREAIFEVMAKQYEAAKLDEGKEAAVIQVVDPAVSPDKKSGPPRTIIVGCTVLLALFLSISWAVVSEALTRMQKSARAVNQIAILKSALLPKYFNSKSNLG